MPVQVTYPGVYIAELPSGNHTISPVATSIAAFVGRTPVGPVDEPVTINNYGDYTRTFGGLAHDYPLSYAVQDFFMNGGGQAIVVRLFEPLAGQGDGVARLRFPPPPPMLPEDWMNAAVAPAGASSLSVKPPSGGDEGEPEEGMVFTIDGDESVRYLVTKFTPRSDKGKGSPASITFVPPLPRSVEVCAALEFAQGPGPAGWTAAPAASPRNFGLSGGQGIPLLGDQVVVSNDLQVYTIIDEPAINGSSAGNLTLAFTVTPKPPANVIGKSVEIRAPGPAAMPASWKFGAAPVSGANGSATVPVVNGKGQPLPGDQFTVGSNKQVYLVTRFDPPTPKQPATVLSFATLDGSALPTDPEALCNCCTLRFSRPVPEGWAIASAKGSTQVTVNNNGGAATGVIDVGDTFMVEGDSVVYTVRVFDRSAGVISFLPEAATSFDSSKRLTFSPPLSLMSSNPGEWGNMLSAAADDDGITDAIAAQFREFGLTRADLFNLTVTLRDARGRTVGAERFLNVSVRGAGKAASYPNRLDRVLKHQSRFARIDALSMVPPASGTAARGSGGNDGDYLETETYIGDPDQKTGLYMLQHVPIFNLLCIPPDRRISDDVPEAMQDLDNAVHDAAAEYCTDRRAIYLVDPPAAWKDKAEQGELADIDPQSLGITGSNRAGIEKARNAAVYFPRVYREDPLIKNRPAVFAPCGVIAGVIAATDVSRGVWKSPAGMDAGLAGVTRLEVKLTDDENGQLNPLGINCLRTFPVVGSVVWGARTLRGADQFEDDYKYLSVRRLTLFIEESIYRGTQWAVFEPNDEALWSSLRLSIGSFLAGLSRQGAFYGYKVSCDATTTTADDIERGIVNVLVQIAPVKPAEFVVIQIQQVAGQKPS